VPGEPVSMVEVETVKSPVVVSAVTQKLDELFHSSFWTMYWLPLMGIVPYCAQDWVVAARRKFPPARAASESAQMSDRR